MRKRDHPVIDGPFAETKELLPGLARKMRETTFPAALDQNGGACREKER